MAFMLPVLLALVYGVLSIGMGMIVYEQLGEATFTGDQVMSQYEGIKDATSGVQVDLCDKAFTAVKTALAPPIWSATEVNKITYSATFAKSGGATTTVSPTAGAFACAASSTALGPKGQVTLTLSYPYTWAPIFGSNMGTITITRQQSVLAF
jgi:hypothetical protein